MTAKKITTIGLMTAVLCVVAPLSIQIGSIPISFTNLVLYFSLFIIGTKKTVYSYFIYLLVGIVGLPVFSGFTGGLAKFFGPTGGLLVGFIFMTLISGVFVENFKNKFLQLVGMMLGTDVCYVLGALWYAFIAKIGFIQALFVCAVPFLVIDILKMIAAMYIGMEVRKRIN